MFAGLIRFNSLPDIGFAHHFYSDNHSYTYNSKKKSFEIVYVNSGIIEAEFNGEKIYAPEGSVFVLFRHLPISVKKSGEKDCVHSTVQVEFDYDFSLITDGTAIPFGRALLPFVTLPCKETEQIKRELNAIISQLGISREKNRFSASMRFVGIIQKLDELARKNIGTQSSSDSVLSYKIKKYVLENIYSSFTLAELAAHLKKTPNYINQEFKKVNGITIKQYAIKKKIAMVAELMKKQGVSFKDACRNVGISDMPYGYRLFKKHMGTTPKEFMKGDTHK